MFNIVLYQPQIPQNTGNIVRTAAVSGLKLHLIRPLGFFIDDKSLKRAGLDYWDEADISVYDNFDDFMAKNSITEGDERVYLITTKGSRTYTDFKFKEGDYFIFGSEDKGLDEYVHDLFPSHRLRIPMRDTEHARCLNLSNSVAIITYEALRQAGFTELV
ncbi:MAG: tRNA (cytidine(34)-2'-O)-methyltransferase [Eubacteriaceae bacterium]|nr:tRNA (cytidine(34)-2'-O)-methyltransferase [Eubacteriaceae bacterium]